MNRWPKHKPKTDARLILEYNRCKNPVTKSVIWDILFKRSMESRDCMTLTNKVKIDEQDG